jgi:hypothetical protein
VGKSVGKWVYLVILYQILLGTAIGAVIGILARKGMKFAKRRQMIDRESMVAMSVTPRLLCFFNPLTTWRCRYVSLALFTTGATGLAGSDDLLAAFACGAAFAWDDWFTESIEDSNFSKSVFLYPSGTCKVS